MPRSAAAIAWLVGEISHRDVMIAMGMIVGIDTDPDEWCLAELGEDDFYAWRRFGDALHAKRQSVK